MEGYVFTLVWANIYEQAGLGKEASQRRREEMGTLIGHVLPGIGFLLIGIWHLQNILTSFVRAPWDFQTRAWWPASKAGKTKKHAELLAIASGAIMSISAELFICPAAHQPLADDWSIPSVHLNNFEHSSISLFFLIYSLVALVSSLASIELPPGLLHALAAVVFSQQLLLFHLHSADHMGLEGHYHWLLQLVIFVCLLAVLIEIFAPTSLLPALGRSLAVALQGSWLIQMGLVLWIPALTPKGCSLGGPSHHPMVVCGDDEMLHRAKALANLQFNWHIAASIVVVMSTLLVLLKKEERKSKYASLNSSEEVPLSVQSSIEMGKFSLGR